MYTLPSIYCFSAEDVIGDVIRVKYRSRFRTTMTPSNLELDNELKTQMKRLAWPCWINQYLVSLQVLKVDINIKIVVNLEILKYSIFDIRYKKILTNYTRKCYFIAMTSFCKVTQNNLEKRCQRACILCIDDLTDHTMGSKNRLKYLMTVIPLIFKLEHWSKKTKMR